MIHVHIAIYKCSTGTDVVNCPTRIMMLLVIIVVSNTGKKCGIVTGINLIEYIAQRQGTTNGTNGMNGTNGTIE